MTVEKAAIARLGAHSIPGQVPEKPVCCSSGDRHKVGVNMILNFMWNVEIFRSDATGEIQMED
jgi:hypothetical protein